MKEDAKFSELEVVPQILPNHLVSRPANLLDPFRFLPLTSFATCLKSIAPLFFLQFRPFTISRLIRGMLGCSAPEVVLGMVVLPGS